MEHDRGGLVTACRNKYPALRWCKQHVSRPKELHVFCDASNGAYGAAVYLRTFDGEDAASVHLLYSKSRLSPIKAATVPRLELLAVLIGTRMVKFLKKELPFALNETHVWSDSQCVLGWLRNSTKTKPTFVENRLREIRQQQLMVFGYVSSAENPADLPSRGVSTDDLATSTLWWNGPDWLAHNRREWPHKFDQSETVSEIDSNTNTPQSVEVAPVSAEDPLEIPTPFGIDATRYSSLTKCFESQPGQCALLDCLLEMANISQLQN